MSFVSIILVSSPLSVFAYYVIIAQNVDNVQDELLVIVNKFLILLYVVVVASCFISQRKFRICMCGVDTFDSWMRQNEFQPDDKLRVYWAFIILNCLLVTGILIVSYTDYELRFSSFEVAYWVMWLVIDLHLKKLQIILLLVEKRFDVLTKSLPVTPDRFIDYLNLYSILERVSTCANQMFGVLLVLHTLVAWLSFLTESYAVVSMLIFYLSKNRGRRQYNMYMIMMTSTFFFFQLFTLAYQRERTANKVNFYTRTFINKNIIYFF